MQLFLVAFLIWNKKFDVQFDAIWCTFSSLFVNKSNLNNLVNNNRWKLLPRNPTHFSSFFFNATIQFKNENNLSMTFEIAWLMSIETDFKKYQMLYQKLNIQARSFVIKSKD